MTTQAIDPQQGQNAFALFGMLSGAWGARVLQVGTELGIADILKDGPKTVEDIARATEVDPSSLTRLMRALVALGIFAQPQPGVYGMTPLAWHTCKDYPGTLRNFILFFGREWSWNIWSELPYAIQTGKSAMRHVHNKNIWQYVDEHPADLRMLNEGIDEFSALINPSIIASYDFSAFQSLVDVGGGYGNFLRLLADRNPSFHGILFDRPSVIEDAKELYAPTPYAPRFSFVGGDFFEEMPAGADAYLYKFIINDWGDEFARKMLKQCRQAIPDHGKLLITEFLLVDNPDPLSALMNVLTFLGFEGGQGRTEEEFRALLKETGFTLTRIVPTPSSLYVIEAVPS